MALDNPATLEFTYPQLTLLGNAITLAEQTFNVYVNSVLAGNEVGTDLGAGRASVPSNIPAVEGSYTVEIQAVNVATGQGSPTSTPLVINVAVIQDPPVAPTSVAAA